MLSDNYFNISIFSTITFFTGIIYLYFIKHFSQRITIFLYSLFVFGYYFYSGIGGAFSIGVAKDYFIYYFIFLIVFSFAFRLGLNGKASFHNTLNSINNYVVKHYKYRDRIIVCYIILALIPLIYPQFRLQRVIAPPLPDITTNFLMRFEGGSNDQVITIITYFKTLFYPFYLFSIVKYSGNIFKFLLLLFIPLYLEYCDTSYIGRSAILILLLQGFICLWQLRPALRRPMLVSLIFILPTFLIFSVFYQTTRLGEIQNIREIKFQDAFQALIVQGEVTFPTLSSKIIDKNYTTDYFEYFLWFITLPFPKFGLIKLHNGLVAYEMAEILTGYKRGQQYFNVILPGLTTESVYIYGRYLFWIHAFIIGFTLAIFARIFNALPRFFPIAIFIGILYGYNLNRAGVQSALPTIINYNILFYIYLFYLYTRVTSKKLK